MDHQALRDGTDLTIIDQDGDTLEVEPADEPEHGLVYLVTSRPGAYLNAEAARALRDYLDEQLGETRNPVSLDSLTGDGQDLDTEACETCAPMDFPTTVLEDAQHAVYGDRGQDYGHPREHWTRTACVWTGLLTHKLAEGEHITPEDVGRLYIGDKLCRDVHAPKRDNRVDIAGYALCLDRLETGR